MEPTTHLIDPDRGEKTATGQTLPEPKLVLSVVEVAGILGISRGLAYELVRTGAIPSLRLGRRLVVPRRRLEELLSAKEGA